MKVQITVNDDLSRRVDAYAKAHYMTRSGLYGFAVMQFLQSQQVIDTLGYLKQILGRLQDTGKLTDDDRRQLDDFLRLVSMLTAGQKQK